MSRILLGETRSDAINRVQERLGPATARPLAEQTFWALAKKGVISMDPVDGTYLIEAELNDEEMRNTAMQSNKSPRRGTAKHFTLNHNSMHKARVSTAFKAKMSSAAATMFAPSLSGAEGFDPNQTDDDSDKKPDQ